MKRWRALRGAELLFMAFFGVRGVKIDAAIMASACCSDIVGAYGINGA